MQLWKRKSWLLLSVTAGMAAVLFILGALQYQWSGRVSEAEKARMAASLDNAVHQFRREFQLDLQRVCVAFSSGSENRAEGDLPGYVQRYENWMQSASDTHWVQSVYLWDPAAGAGRTLLRLSTEQHRFEPVSWPDRLSRLPALRPFAAAGRVPVGLRNAAWIFLEESLLVLHPVPSAEPPETAEPRLRPFRALILELNVPALQQEIIPELAQRYFSGKVGFQYQVAIVSERQADRVLYQSDPAISPDFFQAPDVRIPLWSEPREMFSRAPEENPPRPDRLGPPDAADLRLPPRQPPESGGFRPGRGRGNNLIVFSMRDESRWILLARHREGTLAEVVRSQRYRNLAIGFGILLLLASSMAMIVVSTHRAQRLARLQMDFVAGVSHELRTPIAVIRAAGDNLAAGVVASSNEQIRQYGELIRQEGVRLSGMVEQILQFVSAQAGYKKYNLRPTPVVEAVESLLSKMQPVIDAAGFTVEKNLEAGLPPVNADRTILDQCLENLINNALKYGGASRWMGIRAACMAARGGGREVQITTEDKGVGIDKSDLPHIFDPFFRGRAAAESQIHGNGLGLCIAREGVTAMGGRISVKSKPGVGSSFTLHLPALSGTNAAREEHEEKNTACGR